MMNEKMSVPAQIYNMLSRSKHRKNVFVVNYATGTVTHYPGKKYWEIHAGEIPPELESAHDWENSIFIRFLKEGRQSIHSVTTIYEWALEQHKSGRILLSSFVNAIDDIQSREANRNE